MQIFRSSPGEPECFILEKAKTKTLMTSIIVAIWLKCVTLGLCYAFKSAKNLTALATNKLYVHLI